jgi:hypothetical protein
MAAWMILKGMPLKLHSMILHTKSGVLSPPMPLLKDLIHIPERVHQGDFVLKPLSTLERSLGLRLIIPEFRLGDALLELADFFPRPSSLKDNS